jgi:basic membrane lipoprotein Med (substrate-binding protein (PBP1-ABC) superfamily)
MSIFTTFASLLKSSDVPNVPNATANQVLDAGLNILYLVAGIVGVIVIIIAGITLVTSGSEPDAVKKAKNMIVYAVIGLVVIMSAWAVTWFFIGRFQ